MARSIVRLLPLAVVGAAATLAAEVAWVAHRRLPHLDELDASGLLGDHPGEPLRVVAVGDSTLTGPGLRTPDEIWLRRAFAGIDIGRSVEIVSLAVGGDRVCDVRRRLEDSCELPADLAVLAVGGNDALHGTPARRFATDLDAVLETLLAQVSLVAVANIGDLGSIARIPPPLTRLARRRGRAFGRRIEDAVARHERTMLLDITSVDAHFRDRSLFSPDLFHPTSAGHSLWAQAALPGLCRVLGLPSPSSAISQQ